MVEVPWVSQRERKAEKKLHSKPYFYVSSRQSLKESNCILEERE